MYITRVQIDSVRCVIGVIFFHKDIIYKCLAKTSFLHKGCYITHYGVIFHYYLSTIYLSDAVIVKESLNEYLTIV